MKEGGKSKEYIMILIASAFCFPKFEELEKKRNAERRKKLKTSREMMSEG